MLRRLALALSLVSAPVWADPSAALNGSVSWRGGPDGLGSFSGLHVSSDGQRFWAVSDKGVWASGVMERRDGVLVGISEITRGPLLGLNGRPVEGRDVDAEGLTRTTDGRFHVSFEDNHRLWSYGDLGAAPTPHPAHPDRTQLQRNSALEALARAPNGALFTMPERSGTLERPFPVTKLEDGVWSRAFEIPRRPPFLLVGAEFDEAGRLYVLERAVSPPFGFAVQVRRFELGPSGVTHEEVVVSRNLGPQGNWEGLSLWRDEAGRHRMVIVSDNNGHGFLATTLTEYILSP